MSRFRLSHPTRENIHCIYGHDHMLGFFVETFREGRDKPIKSLDFFTAGKAVTLQDTFEFMIEHGFTTRDDLEAALVYLQDREPPHLASGVQRTIEVVMAFKSAGD